VVKASAVKDQKDRALRVVHEALQELHEYGPVYPALRQHEAQMPRALTAEIMFTEFLWRYSEPPAFVLWRPTSFPNGSPSVRLLHRQNRSPPFAAALAAESGDTPRPAIAERVPDPARRPGQRTLAAQPQLLQQPATLLRLSFNWNSSASSIRMISRVHRANSKRYCKGLFP